MKSSKVQLVKELILNDIRNGILRQNDPLENVRQLCEEYKVSRATITQVLALLNRDGILQVSQGKTTRIKRIPGLRIAIFHASKTALTFHPFWKKFYAGASSELALHKNIDFDIFNIGVVGINITGKIFDNANYAGILCLGNIDFSREGFHAIYRKKIPTVYVYEATHPEFFVSANFSAAWEVLLDKFRTADRKRILYLDIYSQNLTQSQQGMKYIQFTEAYRKIFFHDFPLENCIPLNNNQNENDEVYDKVKAILQSPEVPDALVLSSDAFASSILRAIHDCGKTCPGEILLCGCDNLDSGKMTIPSISTIDVHGWEQGSAGVRLLLDLMERKKIETNHIQVSATPILRESLF